MSLEAVVPSVSKRHLAKWVEDRNIGQVMRQPRPQVAARLRLGPPFGRGSGHNMGAVVAKLWVQAHSVLRI